MKEKLQFIVISFFMWLLFSTINVLANSYQYDSSDVLYDNTGSGLESTDVQGAVGELYRTATDYSSLNGRVTNLEALLPPYTTTEGLVRNTYSGTGLNLGINETVSSQVPWIDFYSGNNIKSSIYYSTIDDRLVIASKNASGQNKGNIEMKGSVTINNSKVLTINDKIAAYNEVTDCNDALTPGVVYSIKGTTASSNAPVVGAYIFVWTYSYAAQTNGANAIQFSSLINSKTPTLWMRSSNKDGVWGSWVQIV